MYFQKHSMHVDICIHIQKYYKNADLIMMLTWKKCQHHLTALGINAFNKAYKALYVSLMFPRSLPVSLFPHYIVAILTLLYILQCPFLTYLLFPCLNPPLIFVHFYSLPTGSLPWPPTVSSAPLLYVLNILSFFLYSPFHLYSVQL